MNTEQFDLIDSICESYEDLLGVNEALAYFDIKEQELICTESVELDAFREDAMGKAKEMLEKFIDKLKIRYQAFIKWVNKQIINLFLNKLEKYRDKDKFNKALAWFKDTNNSPAGKANPISKYLHKAVVKNNKVVSLYGFIDIAADELFEILDGELDIPNLNSENIQKIDAVKLYKDNVEKKAGKFETITSGDKAFIFPVTAFDDFRSAIGLMDSAIDDKNGFINRTEKDLKQLMNSSKITNETYRLFMWRYIQFTKMVNAFLSMSRRYFMACLLSASSIVNAYENAKKNN